MNDLISRQAAIDTEGLDAEIRCEMCTNPMHTDRGCDGHCEYDEKLYEKIMQVLDERIKPLPSAQPERLTDDDFETIRIHLNAYKEKLCNQHRWEEADEYQRIIDRFMAFASAQPDSKETSSTHKALDTISRQEAMEEISKQQTYKMFEGEDTLYLDANDVGSVLASLPSAQPDLDEVYAHAETEAEARYHAERKKGRWIPQDHNKTNGMMSTLVYYYPKCSVCGHCANYTNFCPNCGADMREGAERRTDDERRSN